jgi:hypothetical protein
MEGVPPELQLVNAASANRLYIFEIVANVEMDDNIYFWLGWGASAFKLVEKNDIFYGMC